MYYRLDGRVTHLLLDEFQDTSLVQWDVLRPFAQEVAATADGSRSLFVVGDAKQAIYGWRGGVAELFDQIEHELALDEQSVTSMSDSYRSSGVVLDVVNRVFGGLTTNGALDAGRGAADRWQRSFEEHRPVRDLSGHVTLETSVAAATGDDDGPPPESHERYVARRVQGLYERTGGAGSIGVLVRTNDVGARLISEIGRLGVPVSGEGGGSLADSPAVATVLSALQMADHPGDTASGFHVLNSPMARVVGLTSTDPPQVQLTARRIREMLLNHGYAQTLADWTRALAASCDARGLSRLTQLVALADRSEHVEVLRPSRFVALAEAERVADPKPAPVRVMTVHAAKGLEFDTVVLAELNKTFRDDGPLLLEREHPTGPVTGVYRSANDDVRQLDDRLVRAAAARRADGLMDFISLLYVGMTRARRSLHMMVKPGKLKADGTFARPGLCYAAILREALPCRDEDPAGGQVLYEHGDPGWAPDAAEPEPAREPRQQPIDVPRLGGGGSLPQRFLPTVSPSERAGGEKTVASIMEVSRDSAGAMRYGTMVHEWFRQVGFIDESAEPDRASLRRIARLQMPGTDRAQIEAALDRFFEALHSAEASRVLSRKGASDLWRERPFVVRHGRELLRGCFDRVSIHRDAAGGITRAELVDFKTDHVGPEGPEALVGTYRLQLLAYRQALQALLGLDAGSIHTALWFVGPGIVEEVST
jgi:ATP-dependent exoDNAse (exonuclease V) beta subunit